MFAWNEFYAYGMRWWVFVIMTSRSKRNMIAGIWLGPLSRSWLCYNYRTRPPEAKPLHLPVGSLYQISALIKKWPGLDGQEHLWKSLACCPRDQSTTTVHRYPARRLFCLLSLACFCFEPTGGFQGRGFLGRLEGSLPLLLGGITYEVQNNQKPSWRAALTGAVCWRNKSTTVRTVVESKLWM